MHLSDFKIPDIVLPKNANKIPIKSITSDSRNSSQDCMFAAIKGFQLDGHDYINDAILAGASNILVDHKYKKKKSIPLTKAKNVRKALALISAIYHQKQPNIIAAVTGTNGKTSVCYFLKQIWELNNFKSASLGTLGLISNSTFNFVEQSNQNLTTLDPIKLHKYLSLLKKNGVNRLALEASSHGIEQHRIDGVNFSLACFTNLSHDHLDHHKTIKNYKNQKFRLFEELVQDSGSVIVNIDDDIGLELIEKIKSRNLNIVTYGFSKKAQWRIQNIENINNHKTIKVKVGGKNFLIPTALNSDFQVYNALAAAALAYSSGIPLEHSLLALRNLLTPEGRMQEISSEKGSKIYVDFSHTPQALESILKEKSQLEGKLFLVIGCGGNRDAFKRKKIGEIASKYSDQAIITDDNPRKESPKKIRSEIIRGKIQNKDNLIEIADRKEAITQALELAGPKDTVIIAGKGHENYQEYNNKKIPHNDFLFCKHLIETKVGKK